MLAWNRDGFDGGQKGQEVCYLEDTEESEGRALLVPNALATYSAHRKMNACTLGLPFLKGLVVST